jgi:hypothetical protein
MDVVLVAVYVIAAWSLLSYLQDSMGFLYFGTLTNYLVLKLVIAVGLGWIIIPVGLLCLIFKGVFGSKNN